MHNQIAQQRVTYGEDHRAFCAELITDILWATHFDFSTRELIFILSVTISRYCPLADLDGLLSVTKAMPLGISAPSVGKREQKALVKTDSLGAIRSIDFITGQVNCLKCHQLHPYFGQVDWGCPVGVIASVSFIGAFRFLGVGKFHTYTSKAVYNAKVVC